MGAWLQHGEGWPNQLVHRGSESESGGSQHHCGRQEEVSRLTKKSWECWTFLIVKQACPTSTSTEPPWSGQASSGRETTSTKLFLSPFMSTTGVYIFPSYFYCKGWSLCGVVIKPLVVWLSSIQVQNWRAAQGNLSKGYVGDQVSGLATAIFLLCTPSQ